MRDCYESAHGIALKAERFLFVILSEAKNLLLARPRFFASLRMTKKRMANCEAEVDTRGH